ncbi:hypothetical protein ACQU0X_25670 [Pseudovibrio ascidiaceicola]|uniref:hypothetical protein n=1 Tax=Pseudovibrio ascidiaceicola TaxID=285279 RepID=UPI003D36E851
MIEEKKQLLIKSGEALYGGRWQADLARSLGLSDGRRIRQWLSGDRPIPDGIWKDIKLLLEERGAVIEKVLEDISELSD